LRSSDAVTPAELARAIGVSESSVKRWIDAGRIEALRTPGGHRRVPIAAAVRFIHETGQPLADPTVLGLDEATTGDTSGAVVLAAWAKALEAGDETRVRGLAIERYLAGHDAATICDQWVLPAYKLLRDDCSHPSEACIVLHRGRQISYEVLRTLRDAAGPPLDANRVALTADIGAMIDSLPEAAAHTVLHEAGWDATSLGPAVSRQVLVGAMPRLKPKLVWLSASGDADPAAVADTLHAVASAAGEDVLLYIHGSVMPANGNMPESARPVASQREFAAAFAA